MAFRNRSENRIASDRVCAWCSASLAGRRADAITCSKRCRQARQRFRVGPAGPPARKPIVVAYADPPYPGRARRCYRSEEVCHRKLLTRLETSYPDGWALSTSADALQDVLALCPSGVRICPWVRALRHGRAHRARNGWEPLIIKGGRPTLVLPGENLTDVLVWRGRQSSHPNALIGMKPAAFAEWMFRLLGLRQGDRFDDLFPGSGAVSRAWAAYTRADGDNATSRFSEAQRELKSGVVAAPRG